MSIIRRIAKLCAVSLLGRKCRPRKILRGLAAGYRISVSPAENLGHLLGTSEPHLQKAIKKYVAAGDTTYDIGANMGYVSLSLAKQVGPSGHVLAFEPLPRNVEVLRANIRNNRLTNIQVFDLAASDRMGEAVIRMADSLSTASLIWHTDNPAAIEIVVKTVSIDALVESAGLPQPRFVKIDIEGSEGLAVMGMRRTIAAALPVLFIECSDSGRASTWQLLGELGYQCHSPITGKSVNTFEEYRHSDFIWLPHDPGGADSLVVGDRPDDVDH